MRRQPTWLVAVAGLDVAGTGLGLDISRRIVVERHGGEITFDSIPGRTTARVRLPISR